MTVVKIKNQKAQKSVIKRKLKFENYKNCLEATRLENKMDYLEKNKIAKDFFCCKRKHEEFIKNNKLILKQQRFKSEKHNVFTEEINKIALKIEVMINKCNQLILNICIWKKKRSNNWKRRG